MEKKRLALMGAGRLNEIVANALKDGLLPEYELVGVLGNNPEKTQAFADRHNCVACTDIQALMDFKLDFTAEAASPQAVIDYSETVLESGSHLVVITVGAFADAELYNRVKETARKNGTKVYIASGAVGGFDVLRTAAFMGPIKATMTSKKSLQSLFYSPLFKEHYLTITEPEQAFTGSTKEAIEQLPFHYNVAVATALASAGPEETTLNIDVVPNFRGDDYKIVIEGEEVLTDINIYSRTPRIAGWSIVAVLQNAVSPIVF